MSSDSLKQKLVLGTVQLGLPYGINNQAGKPDQEEAFRILNKAADENIFLLDSAEGYGDSLKVIGAYLTQHSHANFDVISKFMKGDEPLASRVARTLSELNRKELYAYMFHRFTDYQSGKYADDLLKLKRAEKIRSIGVSLYSEEELETVYKDPDVSIIQIPFNPFDAGKKKIDLLHEAKLRGKEIHVRSVFLQGLFFKQPDQLTGNLKEFSASLQEFQKIVKDHHVTIEEACLNFALHQPVIDHVLIGVETCEQLVQNIGAVMPSFSKTIVENFCTIPAVNSLLLNPSTWKP